MITLFKKRGQDASASLISMDELVQMIREKKYEQELNTFRELWPLRTASRMGDDRLGMRLEVPEPWEQKVPRVCVAAEWQKRKGVMTRTAYNGLLLLEVNGLEDTDAAIGLRHHAGRLPYTLLAFVGAEGRSVKIVCRAELYSDSRHGDSALPTDDEQIRRFHYKAYAQAQKVYTDQLNVTVDVLEPRLDRTCYVSSDAALFYNPDAIPFFTDAQEDFVLPSPHQDTASEVGLLPGRTLIQTQHILVQQCLKKAFEKAILINDEDEYRTEVLTRHATYCKKAGVPKALALRLTLHWPNIGKDPLLAESIFDNAYTPSDMRREMREHGPKDLSLRVIPQSTMLMLRTNVFMKQNYQFRKNVLTGVAQYRKVAEPDFDFKDVTPEDRNTMTRRALEAGLESWDKDIKRYIESNDIPAYDPIADYLEHLPRWDGKDRVGALARRVPTTDELWTRFFPVWMRSMVAHWMAKDTTHGNALVPLLIGPQGCGKTTYAGMMLPPELRMYFNDRVNFKTEFDLLNQLSSFALINIDEFDSIGDRQQVVLKYLLSKSDVKLRVPYGKAITSRRRYASFIATTNQPMPLKDPTGARRFLCVNIEGRIDTETPVDYPQLYAQLLTEVTGGMRYWLDDAETKELLDHNEHFRQLDSLDEIILSLFRKPEPGEKVEGILISRIVSLMKKHYPGLQLEKNTAQKVGRILSRMECASRHTDAGTKWEIIIR